MTSLFHFYFFSGVKVTLEESDNEGDQDEDDGKPSVSQSHSHPSGMWRRVVGLCRKLSEKAQTFWLIRWISAYLKTRNKKFIQIFGNFFSNHSDIISRK